MKIETKYKLGDEVYYMDNNKIRKEEVTEICLHETFFKNKKVLYRLQHEKNGRYYEDTELFFTKEELLASL